MTGEVLRRAPYRRNVRVLRVAAACLTVGVITAAAGCAPSDAATQDAIDVPATAVTSELPSPPSVDATLASSGTPAPAPSGPGLASAQQLVLAACPDINPTQQQGLEQALTDLWQINSSPRDASDIQLQEQNVELFIDNTEQVCGEQFTAGQRRNLASSIMADLAR